MVTDTMCVCAYIVATASAYMYIRLCFILPSSFNAGTVCDDETFFMTTYHSTAKSGQAPYIKEELERVGPDKAGKLDR